MKRLHNYGITLIVVLIFSLLAIGCSKKNIDNQVRIGYFSNITHAQALIMKNQKSFEDSLDEEYQVTWTQFNAGPTEVEAMFANELDIGFIGPVPAVNAFLKSKGDVVIIAGVANGGAVLITHKDIKLSSIAGLDGLKIAIPQYGNTQHLSLLNILNENGLSTTSEGGEVEVVAIQNADLNNILSNGEIDGALVPEPWGSILESTIDANVFLDFNEIWMEGNYSTAVVIARKEFIEKYPEVIKKFITIHKQTTEYINSSTEKAKEVVNKELEATTGKALEQDVIDRAFKRIIFSSDISKESIIKFAEINKELGNSSQLPDNTIFIETFIKDDKKGE